MLMPKGRGRGRGRILIGPPEKSALPPPTFVNFPQALNNDIKVFPQVINKAMENCPQVVNKNRENIAERNYIDAPQNYIDAPPNYIDAPQNYIDAPPNYIDAPQNYIDAPPNYIDAPQNYIDAPQNYIVAPQNYIDAPQNALNKLGLKLEQTDFFHQTVASRPDYGKFGRTIKLISNCYKICVPDGYVYHYDVEIKNKRRNQYLTDIVMNDDKKYRCMNTKKNREIICALKECCPQLKTCYPAYDGRKNLYTKRPLSAPFEQDVILGARDASAITCETFVVSVKPVKKKDTNSCAINLNTIHAFFDGSCSAASQEALTAVETILRHSPCMKLTPIGRSFFSRPSDGKQCPIGGGQEIWFGYHQSIRLGEWSPLVNIDISATSFYEGGPVIDYICKVLNWRKDDFLKKVRLNDFEIRCIAKELKRLKIRTTHGSYQKQCRVINVTKESANKLEFPWLCDGVTRNVKVSDYYWLRYKHTIKYPYLPCLHVSPQSKNTYFPMEVCEIIEGQHCRKVLNDEQKKEMIRFTSHVPRERFNKIGEIIEGIRYNSDATCQEFGITVDMQPVRVQGRVYEAPILCYDQSFVVKPTEGQWDIKDKKYIRGASVERWVLISFANPKYCSQEDLLRFSDAVIRICRGKGITLAPPMLVQSFSDHRIKVESVLRNMKVEYDAELVLVVIPQNKKSLYSEIKQIAETDLGLTTQCVKEDKVRKCNPSIITNLSLKMNAKLGGINHFIEAAERPPVLKKPIIVIGADVTHPSPTERTKTSVAAVVGSLDAYPSRYSVTCRVQTHSNEKKTGFEVIQDLESMVTDVLKAFHRKTKGKKPEKIIFYRDGVSDNQFEAVRMHEVKAIRKACLSLGADYQPGITFIIVQKRHHVRFRVEDFRDGVGKCRNVPPGTTVDRTITRSDSFDFYQCSHFSPVGTTRPAYYTVLIDDNKFTADQLQKLTYLLCFTYCRCTKSISVPAPIMYAHLAAFRARQWLMSQVDENKSDSDESLSSDMFNAVRATANLNETMYFV